MRKSILAGAAVAALAFSSVASAALIQKVDDPTGAFSSAGQTGYVAVYDDGVVACNGNPDHTNPQSGEPLDGYIWVGPAHAAANPTQATPGGEAGAGDNKAADDPSTPADESHGPCED